MGHCLVCGRFCKIHFLVCSGRCAGIQQKRDIEFQRFLEEEQEQAYLDEKYDRLLVRREGR